MKSKWNQNLFGLLNIVFYKYNFEHYISNYHKTLVFLQCPNFHGTNEGRMTVS